MADFHKPVEPMRAYVVCPFAAQGNGCKQTTSIEVDGSCLRVQRYGGVELHRCSVYATCVLTGTVADCGVAAGQVRGEPALILPEPGNGLLAGLVLLALLARWRRR